MIATHQTATITVPINFLRDLHSELHQGVFRDVIGHMYFSEDMPPDVQMELRVLGYNPEQFKIIK